jgi:PAS domain S-box-containing protein
MMDDAIPGITVAAVSGAAGAVAGWLIAYFFNRPGRQRSRGEKPEAEIATRLFAIVESTDDAILSKTLDGTITSWNRGAEKIFGYTAEEMVGQSIAILMPPDRTDEEVSILRRIAAGERVDHFETVRIRKDGGMVELSVTISPIQSADGRVIGASKIARDITERKRIEAVARETKARLEAVVENLDEGLAIADLDSNIVTWNSAGLRTMGFSSQDELRRSLPDFPRLFELSNRDGAILPPAEWPLARVLRGDKLDSVDITVRRISTTWERTVTWTGAILNYGETGKLAFLAFRDITAKKHAEEALVEASLFNEQIIAGVGEGIVVVDGDLRYRAFNPVMEKLWSAAAKEVIGKRVNEVVPEWLAPEIAARLRRAVAGENVPAKDIFIPATGAAGDAWFARTDSPLRNAAGEVVGAIGIMHDITDRKIAEEKLRRTIGDLANAQRIGKMGSWEVDIATGHARRSDEALAIFGVSREDDEQNSGALRQRVHPADRERLEAARMAAIRGEKKLDIEYRITLPDGSAKWVQVLGETEREAEGWHLILKGTVLDITERKMAAEALQEAKDTLELKVIERTVELEAAKKQAEAADELKTVFLTTMSHELRTPLNSIIGFTEMVLQQMAGPLNSEQSRQLALVHGSARHLLAIINDILDVSKIEAGQLEIRPEVFDLQASIERIVATVRPMAERKGLALVIENGAGPKPIVSDPLRVEQVLLNLLNNAIKFTDHGIVGVATVSAPDSGREPVICIRVSDTGSGIKPADLETIFQPFRQIQRGTTRTHEGTGLGLTICRRLAGLLNGDIQAESEYGKGSVFTFRLPLT